LLCYVSKYELIHRSDGKDTNVLDCHSPETNVSSSETLSAFPQEVAGFKLSCFIRFEIEISHCASGENPRQIALTGWVNRHSRRIPDASQQVTRWRVFTWNPAGTIQTDGGRPSRKTFLDFHFEGFRE
jgi:hypothetical protein